jgi:hypothetical protein
MTQAPTVIRNASWVVTWDAASASHVYRRDTDLAFIGDTITAIGALPPHPMRSRSTGAAVSSCPAWSTSTLTPPPNPC